MQVSVLRLHMGPVETALLLWVVSLLSIQLETQTFQPAQAFCVSWSSSLSSSLDLFTGVPFKSTSVLTGALYFVLIFCRAWGTAPLVIFCAYCEGARKTLCHTSHTHTHTNIQERIRGRGRHKLVKRLKFSKWVVRGEVEGKETSTKQWRNAEIRNHK